ncbi:hypothetical protein Rahaq2_1199 [Rahnella aquatilis CIP 78.65 = ATCC 33071]|uniref:Uncharacterized protein n=1 Tax=Rahnella aquatilis (strain ATCC 33071 / DSM 4594 / JCM 1683 / NBRC 105701 / NCIMB 13365 / CIP 78.65) TaxID=745277 RepID=H2IZX5_RAHAC|nr:hypothetical protein Rahaq2_1199 [Rahnella aquatilis CIP 78.65 = ATCC 33071]
MRSESGPLMSVLGKYDASVFLKSGERITFALLPARLPLLPIRVITQNILNALDNHYQLDMIDVSVIIVRVNSLCSTAGPNPQAARPER